MTSAARKGPRPPWRPAVAHPVAVGVGVVLLVAAVVVGRALLPERRGVVRVGKWYSLRFPGGRPSRSAPAVERGRRHG
jgi:hypothetical protein